jgi:PAS domain S-box-containing protein
MTFPIPGRPGDKSGKVRRAKRGAPRSGAHGKAATAGPEGQELGLDQAMNGMAGRVAKLGGWVASVPDLIVTWSNETAAIHEEPPGFSPTLEGGIAYYAPEYRDQIQQAFNACVEEGVPFDTELQIITANGRRVWARVIGEAVRDGSDTITRVQGGCQDISEQRFAAAQIQSLASRLHETLEFITDAFFTLDHDWRFTYLNGAAEYVLGHERTQLLGKCIWDEFSQAVGTPAHVAYLRAMTERIKVRFEQFSDRLDAWVHVEVHPSREGLAVYMRDVTERRRADDKQQAQMEGRYRGLLEAAPDAMVVVNQAGQIVLLNLQAEKQFGYRRDELVGRPVTDIIPEGFAERLIADGSRTAAEALAQSMGTGIELSGRRKNGEVFPVEMMLSPLESTDGILVTAAIRDISARKAAERHLAQVEGRYRTLLEAAPDAILVLNQNREVVILNTQLEKLFGYSRAEVLGHTIDMLIPLRFRDDRSGPRALSPGSFPAGNAGAIMELHGLHKSGAEFPVEVTLSPLQTVDGMLITAAIRDVSKRKAAEDRLALTESRYRALLEAAPDAMVLVNHDGEIVLMNRQAEKQFGYCREDLVGQPMQNIIPAGLADPRIAAVLGASEYPDEAQAHPGIELEGRHRDGSDFPIEIMLSPLESMEGNLLTVAIRDISTRKKAEACLLQTLKELNRSNAELEQFAYLASHDLQEPLRMVASYTQLLSKRYKGRLDADADEFIAFAVDGANRMQRLIQDLLAYSRVGIRAQTLRTTASDEALEQALVNLATAIENSGALVTHDALPNVLADAGQLVQLFQNLVANAIKYQNHGAPRVHVSCVRDGTARWLFSVKDNGLGIESRYFERIFGMFQRLHKREEFDGTGIGLAICKKIAEGHGGTISVESQTGHGSTFRFSLAGSFGNA